MSGCVGWMSLERSAREGEGAARRENETDRSKGLAFIGFYHLSHPSAARLRRGSDLEGIRAGLLEFGADNRNHPHGPWEADSSGGRVKGLGANASGAGSE